MLREGGCLVKQRPTPDIAFDFQVTLDSGRTPVNFATLKKSIAPLNNWLLLEAKRLNLSGNFGN